MVARSFADTASEISLPRWIHVGRTVVNVIDTDDDCFKWAVLAGMHPARTLNFTHRENLKNVEIETITEESH